MRKTWSAFVIAPTFADEDQTRNARLAYQIILSTLALNIISILIDFLFSSDFFDITLNLITAVVQFVLLYLVRRGYVEQVGVIFAVFGWLLITDASLRVDGLVNPIITLYVLPILFAGLLVSVRAGLALTFLCIITTIAFALSAQAGVYPQLGGQSTLGIRLGYYITLFGFTGVTVYLSMGAVKNALSRERTIKSELHERNLQLQTESENRERVQNELTQNELRWRFALAGSDTGVWDMNLETREIYRSPRYLELLGYSYESVETLPDLTSLIHPDDLARTKPKREQFFRDNIPAFQDEMRLLCADGTYKWFSYRGKIIERKPDGTPLRIAGTLTDINIRKQMEATLAESELRWRFALEGSDAGVWDVNFETGYDFRSPRYRELLGYDPHEKTRLPDITTLIHPDDYVEAMKIREQFLKGQIPLYTDEFRIRCSDGQYRWFLSRGKVIDYKSDGSAGRVVGTLTDITPRKQMEEAIKVSEHGYRTLFENNPNPMFVFEKETLQFIAVNDAAIALYGYTRDEFLNMTVRDIYPDADIPLLEIVLNASLPILSPPDLWRHRTREGKILHVEITGHETIFQGKSSRLVLVRDMTMQKETEASLHTSQELFSRVFDTIPVGVAISRAEDGRYISVNPYLAAMLDFQPEDMIDHTSIELGIVDSSFRTKFIGDVKTNDSVSTAVKWDVKLRARTGRIVDALTYSQQLKSNGEDTLLWIVVDVTELKRAERERLQIELLQSELDKQREIVNLKERFISSVSHEFRSPLTIMLSGVGILRLHDGKFTSDQRIERLTKIETQIYYLSDLLDRVLTIGKARAGKFQFDPRAIDIVNFCRQLFEDFQLTDNNQHTFIFEAAGDYSHAHMDEKLLQHILMNLISNAVKYSPAGKEIKMRMNRDEDQVVIEISDQGIGIPEEEQNQVFEPFFRSQNAGSIKGTGLGLAITKESVDVHHGSIIWHSQLGQGTTFIVRLPGGFQPIIMSA